ncbi:MAG: complex I NDUFA9 subunit family protein [Pseudomonadota bacterium]
MVDDTRIATVFGGSGFIGRYVTRRLAKAGWRVRVAVRRPNDAHFVRTYGVVGQVEPVQANIRDDASVRAAIQGANAVVNCIGILFPDGKNRFDAVQAEGPGTLARVASEAGVARFVHVSAIGADAESESDYARTKAAGEAAVHQHFPTAVILRPSIVFGVEDQFFNRFAAMARFSPGLPVVGPETRFQPVYVDDVAAAVEVAVGGAAAAPVYELGGPEVATFGDLMRRMLSIIGRRRALITVPFWIARIQGRVLDLLPTVTFGLVPNSLLTLDQVRLLARDNVASPDLPGLEAIGVTPTPMEAVLERYLYSYRPYGQYSEITESARDQGE